MHFLDCGFLSELLLWLISYCSIKKKKNCLPDICHQVTQYLRVHFTVKSIGERSWTPRALAHPHFRDELPLHDICLTLGEKLLRCLPALHALIMCDTTSTIPVALNLSTIKKMHLWSWILTLHN